MTWVKEAKYFKDYQIWIKFNDGKEGIIPKSCKQGKSLVAGIG